MLKSKKEIKVILTVTSALIFLASIFWLYSNSLYSSSDYIFIDYFYNYAIENHNGPAKSEKIIYATIDETAYRDYFKMNRIDRGKLADTFTLLKKFEPAAVLFDIIFKYPSEHNWDSTLVSALKQTDNVFFPVGFITNYDNEISDYRIEEDSGDYNIAGFNPVIPYTGEPVKGFLPKTSLPEYNKNVAGLGHINLINDGDGVFRSFLPIIKYKNYFVPSLPLLAFLKYNEIPPDSIIVKWGDEIVIPKLKEGWLNEDVHIPIDQIGRAYIPYPAKWSDDFEKISIGRISNLASRPETYYNIAEKFEGRFVLLGDISDMSGDIGKTTLESNSFKISIHAAFLNSLLVNRFYSYWSTTGFVLLVDVFYLLFGFILCIRSNTYFYGANILLVLFAFFFSYNQIISFSLFPFFSFTASVLSFNIISIAVIEIITSKEKIFIKNAFARYVSPDVVNQLIENPGLLELRGEEKMLTIMFADIANFTSISEQTSPSKLAELLNYTLTELTSVIIEGGGTIDKYLGDGIMVLFGAPLKYEDHAQKAVDTALNMLERLKRINEKNELNGFPELKIRIGINTGKAITGNLGSQQVFDYTAVGDNVNTASRLEGINKFYNSAITISQYTYGQLKNISAGIRMLDKVRLKGKSESMLIYEIYNTVDENYYDRNFMESYNAACRQFFNGEIETAKEKFEELGSQYRGDNSIKSFLERIHNYGTGDFEDSRIFYEK